MGEDLIILHLAMAVTAHKVMLVYLLLQMSLRLTLYEGNLAMPCRTGYLCLLASLLEM